MPSSMHGKNCSGRLISLLNDKIGPQPQIIRLPSITPSVHDETLNNTPSPVALAATPMQAPLLSKSELAFQGFPSQEWDPRFSQHILLSQHENLKFTHPPVPQPSGMLPPYRFRCNSQFVCFDLQRAPEQQARAEDAWPKKKRHRCPLARQYNCGDSFTTSGHASRHAKKHTGKKDVLCAECDKAFARKDNMEQHCGTHRSGSRVRKGNRAIAKKMQCREKQPRITPVQSRMPSLSCLLTVDPTLQNNHVRPSCLVSAVGPLNLVFTTDQYPSYFNPTDSCPMPDYPTGSFCSLGTLAIAASKEKHLCHSLQA
jgi:hypothetical protein